MRFGWNMWAWARLHAARKTRSTYLYRFAHAPPGREGATHGVEMVYIFNHLDLYDAPWTDRDRALAETMTSYCANFAKAGDPNGPGLPYWTESSTGGQRALIIDESGFSSAQVPNGVELARIDRIYAAIRVLMRYGVVIAAGVSLLILALMWRLISLLVRHRPMPGS